MHNISLHVSVSSTPVANDRQCQVGAMMHDTSSVKGGGGVSSAVLDSFISFICKSA